VQASGSGDGPHIFSLDSSNEHEVQRRNASSFLQGKFPREAPKKESCEPTVLSRPCSRFSNGTWTSMPWDVVSTTATSVTGRITPSTRTASPTFPEGAPLITEVVVTVVDSSGRIIGYFKMEKTETIMELKRRIQQERKVNVSNQQLSQGLYVPGDEDMLATLSSRPILKLEISPCDPKLGGRLLDAARNGDSKGVQEALRAHADPNFRGANGWSPLFIAAAGGHIEVVRVLHGEGADVDVAAYDGATPLLIATLESHVEMVRFLCEVGADKDRASLAGATPLLVAAQAGNLHAVRVLCEAGAGIDVATLQGATPLYTAAQQGHLQVVQLLCEMRADKNKATQDEETPLRIAQRRGHTEVARFLSMA